MYYNRCYLFFHKKSFRCNTKDNDNYRESESYPDHGQIWRNFDNPDRRKLRKFENKTCQAGQVMCFLFSEENDFSIEFPNGMVFLYVKILEYKRIFVVIHTVMQSVIESIYINIVLHLWRKPNKYENKIQPVIYVLNENPDCTAYLGR